jgi:hypothetical protein
MAIDQPLSRRIFLKRRMNNMEFKSLDEAYDFMCASEPGSALRLDAAIYLVKNADEAMKEKLIRRFKPPAPPSVEPAFYDDKGKPYYNFQEVVDSLGMEEETRARVLEMLRERSGVIVEWDGELHRRQ